MRRLNVTIPDEYLIEAIIVGITDENIARTVRFAQFSNADELYAYMSTFSNLPSKNKKNKTAAGTKSDRTAQTSHSWSTDKSRAVKEGNAQPADDKNKLIRVLQLREGGAHCEKVSYVADGMRAV